MTSGYIVNLCNLHFGEISIVYNLFSCNLLNKNKHAYFFVVLVKIRFTFEASSGLSVTFDDRSSLTFCVGFFVVLDGLLLKYPFVTFINIFKFFSDLSFRLCFSVELSYAECSKMYNIAIVKAKIWENIRANRHNLEHWRILK